MSGEGSGRQTRRGFLAVAGFAAPAAAAAASGRQTPSRAEYGFAPGLTYLNTASLGPTPRSVLATMTEAWAELETNPVGMAYGAGPLLARTDQARAEVAVL